MDFGLCWDVFLHGRRMMQLKAAAASRGNMRVVKCRNANQLRMSSGSGTTLDPDNNTQDSVPSLCISEACSPDLGI